MSNAMRSRLLCVFFVSLTLMSQAAYSHPAAPAAQEKIPHDGPVEVKWGGAWRKATIIKHDGPDLFLVQYDRYPASMAEWVTIDRMRAIGSTRDVPYARPNASGVKPPVPPKIPLAPAAGAGTATGNAVVPATGPATMGALVVGSKVDVKVGEKWTPATIVKQEKGQLLVKYDNVSDFYDQWIPPERLRLSQGAAAAKVASDEVVPDRSAAITLKGDQPWAYQPDPAAPAPPLSHASISLGKLPASETLDALFVSSPKAAKAVLSEYVKPTGARLQKLDLATGSAGGFVPIPDLMHPMALSPDGKRVALRASPWTPEEKKGRVEVWDIGLSTCKRVVAFTPYVTAGRATEPQWAGFVDNDHLLTVGGLDMTLWELPAVKAVYTMTFDQPTEPALSPGGKYVLASSSQQAYFFEALTGKSVGFLPDTQWGGSVAFRPDGKQALSYVGGRMTLYDLAADGPRIVSRMDLRASARFINPTWVADNFILFNGRTLVDVANGMVAWEYSGASEWLYGFLGGRFYYIARSGPRRTQVDDLASTTLPEARVTTTLGGTDMNQYMAIHPGMQVSVNVNLSCDEAQRTKISTGLTALLKANGITVADNQPSQLNVSESAGKSSEVTYRMFANRGVMKTTISEKKVNLDLVAEGQAVWHLEWVAGIPNFISIKKDQTIEQAVAASQESVYNSVLSARLPRLVPKPGAVAGVGKSVLTTTGPEPAEVKP